MHYLTANLGTLCALDERILPCFLSLSTECERIDPPLPCASCITCINLFSPRFLASYFARRGGRPTQPGSSDPRGCCITNITSPLFVYFLPSAPVFNGAGESEAEENSFPHHRRKFFQFFLVSRTFDLICFASGWKISASWCHQCASSWPWLKPRLKSDPG